jgi:hypothetical protein
MILRAMHPFPARASYSLNRPPGLPYRKPGSQEPLGQHHQHLMIELHGWRRDRAPRRVADEHRRIGAQCTACGHKGATLQHPGWAGADVGFMPFLVGGNEMNIAGGLLFIFSSELGRDFIAGIGRRTIARGPAARYCGWPSKPPPEPPELSRIRLLFARSSFSARPPRRRPRTAPTAPGRRSSGSRCRS